MTQTWLALVIGNSRLHWGRFVGTTLQTTWETPHLSETEVQEVITEPTRLTHHLPGASLPPQPELWIASVVPAQAQLWATYPQAQFLTLAQIPIANLYPTLGIDRALALWGALSTVGSPVLVIDAGTALTFTGVNSQRQLVGGAILPGLGLQLRTLHQNTADLPLTQLTDRSLPDRWARDTQEAIVSGILYTLLAGMEAFIQDWWRQFPGSAVVLTGGDGDRLLHGMQHLFPATATHLQLNPQLVLQGIGAIKFRQPL